VLLGRSSFPELALDGFNHFVDRIEWAVEAAFIAGLIRELPSPSADEPDDFDAGSFGERGRFPFGLADDFAIQLDCDARRVDFKDAQQLRNVRAFRNVARLSVYHNLNRLG
jgi:hypothetical protein